MANRYVFNTTLEGFINVYEDSGKFNNRTFAYKFDAATLEQAEKDREELLKWAKSKATGRVQEAMTPWDDEGLCKYTYGAGDGSRKGKPEPIFVDSDGEVIDRNVLKDVRRGTKVRLIVQQKPYSMGPNVGTSLRVLGVQIIELATGNGAVDSGDLSVDDVAALFGKADGYKASEPAVRKAEDTVGDGDSYDF
ncbi:ssDNA binding protein [Synechococcus phage Syn5]|uniref:SsDNA binding protein n=1 Tax=Synechococcus phage Syn5 TaxID=2914003 RepID=A4ZRA2_9CAUD|nr:ssDNA binding protein [Synechococcus phage Syn5]ABP87928.1 ssDNA binding protein [Synechococcus phage Syn5]